VEDVTRIHNHDGAKAVRVEDATVPKPQSGELLVRVHAAGVNSIDWKIRGIRQFLKKMLEGLVIYKILKNRKTVTLNIIEVTHFL
jgi:NADPH:quinone reductase-like Zn-dependent oxidoreductase